MKTTRPIFPSLRPSFKSERLLFRPIEASDAEDFHAIRTDIEVMKWTSQAKPDVDIEATRAWLSRFLPPNNLLTFSFSIEELSNPGKVIGAISVHKYNPPEFGYLIAQNFWGRGFGTESVRAFLQVYWALERKIVDVDEEDQEHERLRAATDVENKASRNVLQKCGFNHIGDEKVLERVHAKYYLEAQALT